MAAPNSVGIAAVAPAYGFCVIGDPHLASVAHWAVRVEKRPV
jgi:hypothetical protein